MAYGEKEAHVKSDKIEEDTKKAKSTQLLGKTEDGGFGALTRSISRRLSRAPTILMSSIDGSKRRASRSNSSMGGMSKGGAITTPTATTAHGFFETPTNNATTSPSDDSVTNPTATPAPGLDRRTSKYGSQLSPGLLEHSGYLAVPPFVKTPLKGRLRGAVLDHFATNIKAREEIQAQLIQALRSRRYNRFKDECLKQSLKIFLGNGASTGKPSQAELEKWADDAWESAKSVPNSAESNLGAVADDAWLKAMEDHGHLKMRVATIDEETVMWWKKSFEETWERAWKSAWKAAWSAIWTGAWGDAAKKGVEFGIQEFMDGDSRLNAPDAFEVIIESQQSFKQVRTTFAEKATYMDGLRTTFSMFKELNHLHTALQNSLPVSHENVMEISLVMRNKVSEQSQYRFDCPKPHSLATSHADSST